MDRFAIDPYCKVYEREKVARAKGHTYLERVIDASIHENSSDVQGGQKNLSVAITNEFYTFDLMEIHVKDPSWI